MFTCLKMYSLFIRRLVSIQHVTFQNQCSKSKCPLLIIKNNYNYIITLKLTLTFFAQVTLSEAQWESLPSFHTQFFFIAFST